MCNPENASVTTITNNDGGGLVTVDFPERELAAATGSRRRASVIIDGKKKGEEEEKEEDEEVEVIKPDKSCKRRAIDFYWGQEFLILILLSICLARAYPELGAIYVYPDITASWLAVSFIFFFSGMTLQTKEFTKSVANIYFNAYVLIFNFGVVSSFVFGVSRGLAATNLLTKNLADGMTICACLPLTVNLTIILTTAVGGDAAAAVFNTAASNMIGIFLSPVLILGYLHTKGEVALGTVFYQEFLRVVFPVLVGQVFQQFTVMQVFAENHTRFFKRISKYCLVYIVYTTFCKTFLKGSGSSTSNVLLMVVYQFILLISVMTMAWYSLRALYPNQPKLRAMGFFGCHHKTISVGVPLINAIYHNSPNLGSYTLPLLIWHPMQLVVGTLLEKRLTAFVQSELKRLGATEDDVDSVELEEKDTAEATEEGRAIGDTAHVSFSSDDGVSEEYA